MYRAGGAVADACYGVNYFGCVGLGFVIGYGHLVGQEADVDILDAGQLADVPGDVGLAGGAGHAGDVEFLGLHGGITSFFITILISAVGSWQMSWWGTLGLLGLGMRLELGFLENPEELSFIWRLSHCEDCN